MGREWCTRGNRDVVGLNMSLTKFSCMCFFNCIRGGSVGGFWWGGGMVWSAEGGLRVT